MTQRKRGSLVYRCKLSPAVQRKLAECFAMGATARAAAPIAKVARATATLFFRKIRAKIHAERERRAPFAGTVEVDESYFHAAPGGRKARRASKVRGASTIGLFPVVGAVERETRRVITECVLRADAGTLSAFLSRYVSPDCKALFTDSFRGYNGARFAGYNHHTVNHRREFFNKKTGACTNMIESVWSRFKRHLCRFCGGWRHYFRLWLSECEFRCENKTATFFDALMKVLRA